ncbi:MAG: PH domain-containing protein [Verrucomicrobiales bacterium]
MTIPPPVADAFSRLLRLPPPPSPPPGDEDSALVFRASRKYLTYRTAAWGVTAGLLLLPLSGIALILWNVSSGDATKDATIRALALTVLGFAVLQLAVSYALLRIDYAWRWYVVTDRSLRVREGVLHVREMTVTFANIQNLSIEQGPLQRIFGISDLRVDTAGGGGSAAHAAAGHGKPGPNLHSACLRGLDNPDTVRGAIQQRLRGRTDAGLGDPEDAVAADALHPLEWSPDLIWAASEMLAEAKALAAAASDLAEAHGRGSRPTSPTHTAPTPIPTP